MSHTIIIGNGIAGITTARQLRKSSSKARITVISGESPYFFSRTALMYVYMGHMKWPHIQPYEGSFWKKNRIELVQAWVDGVDFAERTLHLHNGLKLAFDQLVLATGSKPAFYNWPGQDLAGVQGLYSLQDLEKLEAHTPAPGEKGHRCQHAVVAGGGLIGVELAEMLLSRNVAVTMLVREKHFWGNVLTANEARAIEAHMQSHGVKLLTNTELISIDGDSHGRVEAVHVSGGERIPCQLVGITTGVKPNVDFLRQGPLQINRGILVNEMLETNMAGVYAAGDCAEMRHPMPGRRPVEAVWYTGRMMGECLGNTLAGVPTPYRPGPWFNSAKFFDIEYQTYGEVSPEPSREVVHCFWNHPRRLLFITLSWHPITGRFLGINAFGTRLRHEFFHRALLQGLSATDVVRTLKNATFDPEFYKDWTRDFQEYFFSECKQPKGVYEA